eukprot:TRINITY_DN388_c0_g1_i1.p1 TRINITY_DN388_c0_g1~~TRINITY_DN388_c0_g1_i1.p1  ORF type:complete len:708 (+),score=245.89 TRINITY_DN388_c0_g1_i1:509-2632(+)
MELMDQERLCCLMPLPMERLRDSQLFLHIHHMKELEHNEEADKVSVLDTVVCSHPFRRILVVMEQHLKSLIEESEEKDSEKLQKLQENLEYVQSYLVKVYGENGEKEARKSLRVLGFDEFGETQPVSSLSGGLRMRVALACAFFIDPELLLLDEPTNHLDMPSVLWLENKLRGYKGSFLLVTHDRTLLENVVTSVMMIQDCMLCYYDMGFKEFEKTKETEDCDREKMIEQFMMENRGGLDSSDPKYLRREKYRAWMSARAERKMMLEGKFTFSTPTPLEGAEDEKEQSDITLINVENVRFSYNPENLPFIFDTPISYRVRIGTRVGIMGPNGAGKSTFLKLITGKLPATEGTITTHPTYTLAYFGQHSTKELNLDLTPFEFMSEQFPEANPVDVKNHLKKTSVADDTMNMRMSRLSFSQRSCVIFAKLTFVPPHLLIMDEPTNFLDLESVDSLISAVKKFKGGLIVVTHNRDFLRRTAEHYLSIVPGHFLEFKTMKEAERATYSFITALEEGRAVDFKKAIQENRGGGNIQSADELAARQARLTKQQMIAKEKEEAKRAEEERLAKIEADKEAKRQAKIALQKTDWVAGDKCFAPVKGNKYEAGTVVRNVPAMGVTVELVSGKTVMVEAKKLRVENPVEEAAPKPAANAAGGAPRGGRGGARGGAAGGRGGAAGAARGGAGAARGARGGARGGAQGGAARGGKGGKK